MHLRLFTDHTYMFRSPSATIFREYSSKEYNKKSVWRISSGSEFIKCYNILKLVDVKREKMINGYILQTQLLITLSRFTSRVLGCYNIL